MLVNKMIIQTCTHTSSYIEGGPKELTRGGVGVSVGEGGKT